MSRKLRIILISCLVVAIIVILTFSINQKDYKADLPTTEKKPDHTTFKKINDEDYEKLIKEKCDFIVYIGRDTCWECSALKPILREQLYEYKIYNVYWYDTLPFVETMSNYDEDSEEYKKLFEEYMQKKEKFNFQSVPTVIVYKKGELYKIMDDYIADNYLSMTDKEQIKEEEKGLKRIKEIIKSYKKTK